MKLIRVNMTDRTIKVAEVPKQYAGLGGRGLSAMMINAEVPPRCDALGPENKLIVAPGLLSGTSLVNTSRVSIGAKSPLTGTIKESNSGGKIAACLGKLGITAIVVEGQAPAGELYLLTIDQDGKAELQEASRYKGMRTYALCAKLLEDNGPKNTIMCIGPAGEYRLSSASIQTTDVDDRPCRAAGRGGLGAVMGAKGLKAIVVSTQGKSPDAIVDPDMFKEAAKTFAQALRDNPFTGKVLPQLGTASTVAAVNALGAFPSYNATRGVFEGWEKISGEALAKLIQQRGGKTEHMGCAQCIVHCSNEFVDERGKFVTSSLEYETIWSMGAMLGIDDLDTIARLDFLCDDIGLDTINTGVAVAVAMDAGHKSFGDRQAAIAMVEEIAQGTALGLVLGNGPEAVGQHFNHHRVPAVKGQSIAAYDPRAMQGNGVTYATSTMGADHTAGNMLGLYLAGKLNPLSAEGQVDASRKAQIGMAAMDCTGMCLLAGIGMAAPAAAEAMFKMLSAKLGAPIGFKEYGFMGMRVLKAEHEFNQKAGFTSKDDRLPRFFYEEPLPPHNKVFAVSDEELDKFYNF
ncbi:MAG: aldehyde ferredoxin oxidoreductase [Desulfobacteraceae bacterium]|nr:MAG: aldehyde ferredoxin oxidoreductase [Desulfobacteraceae bacterium]